jgi:low temperature requirement protein LtrA
VSGPEQLLRRRAGPLGASFLELFFDLAFVLALSQVVSILLADLSVAGALRTALLLAPVWLAWSTTTWSTDWYDPGELAITHPTERGTVAAVAVTVAGPALFLAGRVLLSVALHRRFSWPRLGGLLAMFVAAVVAIRLPLLAASAITTAVLFVVAAVDHTGVFSPPRVGQH